MSDPQISAVHSGSDLLPLKPSSAGGEPKVGMYLDRYYLEESIGEGATATIFRSFHKLLRIPVAIKVYKREAMADDPIGVQRFLSEAQMLIRLEHPNIVRVLDIAVRDGAPYIVFEYVGELSLQGMINNMGLLPPLRIAQIGAQVSAALEAAAKSGLLHRDVKPDNILIRKDGLAKLADFGIATHRAKDGRTADELARAGLISGTPQYISPEQITTPDQIDFRADIYSLGATLYHSGCGHPPFERDSIDELLHAQLEDFPIPLHSLDPNFDPELSEIIAKMLNKEPIDRFATLAELRKRLESVANRIQGEVSERRRNAMSSGAMPTFVFAPEGSSTPTSSSEDRPVSIAREKSGSVVKRSGSKSSPSDSQLALREPSQGLRTAVWAVAALVVCLVLYVLIRTAH
ncbi:MAG: serine/threonine-protein kinase [Polyangia bacterium]